MDLEGRERKKILHKGRDWRKRGFNSDESRVTRDMVRARLRDSLIVDSFCNFYFLIELYWTRCLWLPLTSSFAVPPE